MGEYRHFELPAQRLVKRQNPVKSGFATLSVRPLAVMIDRGVTMPPFAWPVRQWSLPRSGFAAARKIEAPLPFG